MASQVHLCPLCWGLSQEHNDVAQMECPAQEAEQAQRFVVGGCLVYIVSVVEVPRGQQLPHQLVVCRQGRWVRLPLFAFAFLGHTGPCSLSHSFAFLMAIITLLLLLLLLLRGCLLRCPLPPITLLLLSLHCTFVAFLLHALVALLLLFLGGLASVADESGVPLVLLVPVLLAGLQGIQDGLLGALLQATHQRLHLGQCFAADGRDVKSAWGEWLGPLV
mmetsp:Transcript_13335/g.36187  ORF Transcript_13335/g.36187 Transcript_13335/m.36187 type:complete len:219 (+) Transcript_13335:710-1366(+)